MCYKLFLDDIREVSDIYSDTRHFVLVRNYEDFLSCIKSNGLPTFISFDNDLGADENGNILPDGYACAKWLVYESCFNLSNLKFRVHSANTVAKVQIQSLLDNYIQFLKDNGFS